MRDGRTDDCCGYMSFYVCIAWRLSVGAEELYMYIPIIHETCVVYSRGHEGTYSARCGRLSVQV